MTNPKNYDIVLTETKNNYFYRKETHREDRYFCFCLYN